MLIDFSVTNYLSIADTVQLSLVASNSKEMRKSNVFSTSCRSGPDLLRSAAIYGPNASGKSNILKAIDFMVDFILKGSHGMQEGEEIRMRPFRFDKKFQDKPSEFEVNFINEGIRYQYGFAATRKLITSEWLFAFPNAKPQRWFERSFNAELGKTDWYFGAKLQGHKSLWKDSTRSNALFLSTAVYLNSEQLRPIFDWFKLIQVVTADKSSSNSRTIDFCEDPTYKTNIIEFLSFADRSINELRVEDSDIVNMIAEKTPEFKELTDSEKRAMLFFTNEDIKKVSFFHSPLSSGDYLRHDFLDIKDESSGTRKLFTWAGTWLDIILHGKIGLIDELETSLHPQLLIFLLQLINNKNANRQNGQLVFTTHDTILLQKSNLLRRDQFWFVEKDNQLKTELYPLSDFKPRKEEALEKGYLQGRYGAIPFTDAFNFEIEINEVKRELQHG